MYYSPMASKPVTPNPQASLCATNPLIEGLTCPMVEFYRAQGYKPDDSVAYLMRRIISVASQQIERELEPTGLTNAQWVPLLKLCRRVRSSDDRRVVNLELTEAGRVAAKGIPDILCRVQNAHLSGFSAEEWQVLKGFLRRILDTAQSMQSASEKASGKSPASLITPAPSQADHEQQA